MAEELEKSWYTKYRPSTMEDYCGDSIKDTVNKRFRRREDMPHVIMVDGPRGTGKTTFSRIISKYFLCQNFSEDGPCGECEMCQQIDEILISGETTQVECPGVTELDATIMNGKEAIQEVLEDAKQEPIYTDIKVLIVDECHMISSAGQNSMLKIIEDIPKHLVVIFATTNPEKVLQTIKSRCQLTLHTQKQTIESMTHRLEQICKLEGLVYSEEALRLISKNGNRVPRECINLLETISKTYNREVTVDNIVNYIGDESNDLYIDYFNAANKSLCDILVYVRALRDKDGMDIGKFAENLSKFVLDSMYIKHGIALEEYPPEYIKAVKQLFDTYTSSDFDVLLQCMEYLNHNLTAENQERNETLLVITAMRISKIGLLANGLSNEQENGEEENRISLLEHSKRLKVDNSKALEKLKMDLSLENISEEFDEVTTISDTANIIDEVSLPSFISEEVIEENDKPEFDKESIGSEVDDFFDN